jgi:L-ascorbate metabolism protein UlaG (beta-lactamase superfamily)
MTFYGNQHFRFVTPGGKTILINPWVNGNPDWPKDMKLEDIRKVDAIFVSSGHGDDMGNADEIAKQSGRGSSPRPSSVSTSSSPACRRPRSSGAGPADRARLPA